MRRSKEDVDPRVKEYFGRSSNGEHFCLTCGHVAGSSSNLRAHVESKHYSPWYKCRFCDQTFKIRNSRVGHERRMHKKTDVDFYYPESENL